MSMGDTYIIEISGIGTGGAGVGRLPDGRVTFVHRTSPGERVEVRLTDERRRWTRSELVRVVHASSSRRVAPCPHYERCGGCTLEHLTYAAQLEAKRQIVAEALRRIGGLELDVPPVVPSPREFRYRNRVSFSLRRGADGVVAGFHELNRPDRIVDVSAACLLPEEAVALAWGELRRHWGEKAARLPAGRQLRLTVRGTADGATTLLVEGGRGRGDPDALLERVAGLAGIWHRPRPADAPKLLAGRPDMMERWRGEDVTLGGTAFLQVNRGAAALLEEHVSEIALTAETGTLVDAYCGVGLHARRLARAGWRVTGIDTDRDAVQEARRACPDGTFLAGPVEERLEETLPADLVILNPPRTGLHRAVPEMLVGEQPGRLVYVSCDPATLARDLNRLSPGYRAVGLRCFDLFPQTSHVETVVELECATT
ncbi:MAG: TRAM domain-containing protein [Gemmatimonadota bacterium]